MSADTSLRRRKHRARELSEPFLPALDGEAHLGLQVIRQDAQDVVALHAFRVLDHRVDRQTAAREDPRKIMDPRGRRLKGREEPPAGIGVRSHALSAFLVAIRRFRASMKSITRVARDVRRRQAKRKAMTLMSLGRAGRAILDGRVTTTSYIT